MSSMTARRRLHTPAMCRSPCDALLQEHDRPRLEHVVIPVRRDDNDVREGFGGQAAERGGAGILATLQLAWTILQLCDLIAQDDHLAIHWLDFLHGGGQRGDGRRCWTEAKVRMRA
jgi:hypothetical protein